MSNPFFVAVYAQPHTLKKPPILIELTSHNAKTLKSGSIKFLITKEAKKAKNIPEM